MRSLSLEFLQGERTWEETVPELDLTPSGGAVLKMGVCNTESNLKTILQTSQLIRSACSLDFTLSRMS